MSSKSVFMSERRSAERPPVTTLPPPSGAPMTLPPPTGAPPVPTLPRLAAAPTAVTSPNSAPDDGTAPPADAPVARPMAGPPQVAHAVTPRGFVVPRSASAMRGTTVAGLLMLLAYSVVVVAIVLLAAYATREHRLVRELGIVGEPTDAQLARLQAFEDSHAWVDLVLGGAWLAGMVLTAVWSVRVAKNLERLGQQVSTGEAFWAWLVPVWNIFGGFRQIRKAPGAAWPVSAWQLSIIAPYLTLLVSRWAVTFRAASDVAETRGITTGTWGQLIRDVWIVALIVAGFVMLAFVLASRTVYVIRRNFAEIEAARRELVAR